MRQLYGYFKHVCVKDASYVTIITSPAIQERDKAAFVIYLLGNLIMVFRLIDGEEQQMIVSSNFTILSCESEYIYKLKTL